MLPLRHAFPPHTFSYGLGLVNEARTAIVNGQVAYSTIYFDYDGHGSVRALTDATGTVTDNAAFLSSSVPFNPDQKENR